MLCILIIRYQVEPIANPNENVAVEGWINAGYTKLHIWNLVEYETVVYLDADIIVLENVDEVISYYLWCRYP